MLVISRKVDEEIVLITETGIPVVVSVNRLKHNEVVLGIKAPLNIRIYRSELLTNEPRREDG